MYARRIRGASARPRGRLIVLLAALLSGYVVVSADAGTAFGETVTFGSPLNVPASMNTNELDYAGTETPFGAGIVRTDHSAADTALWNVEEPAGEGPSAPAAGEIKTIKLKGCAQRPTGAPAPLTQIHFQDLHPTGGGAVQVEATSAPFEIPVCGEIGASDETVTTYTPEALCVLPGDYVDFNDEGGYEPNFYRGGVPYQVIGSVQGATMDSFIKDGGTNNGATFSPSSTEAMGGFASNSKQELMLQATELEGNTYYCHGAPEETKPTESPAPKAGKKSAGGGSKSGGGGSNPKLVLLKKSARVKKGFVKVSLACKLAACHGTLVLKAKTAGKGGTLEMGHHKLKMSAGTKKTVRVRLSHLGRKRIRAAGKRVVHVAVTLRAASGEPAKVGTLLVR